MKILFTSPCVQIKEKWNENVFSRGWLSSSLSIINVRLIRLPTSHSFVITDSNCFKERRGFVQTSEILITLIYLGKTSKRNVKISLFGVIWRRGSEKKKKTWQQTEIKFGLNSKNQLTANRTICKKGVMKKIEWLEFHWKFQKISDLLSKSS